MSDTLKSVEDLLITLQKHNVRRYRGPIFVAQDKYDCIVDILLDPINAVAPAVVAPVVEDSTPSKPFEDPELCRCGHSIHAHVNGLCLSACDEEKCAGPEIVEDSTNEA